MQVGRSLLVSYYCCCLHVLYFAEREFLEFLLATVLCQTIILVIESQKYGNTFVVVVVGHQVDRVERAFVQYFGGFCC